MSEHENRSSAEGLRGAVSEVASQVSERARAAGQEAKKTAADTASSVTDAVKKLADRQIGAGATMIGHCATSVRLAADDLERNSPTLGKLVRGFAQTLDTYGQGLQDQTSEQLVRSASDFTRRKPALVFGIAALAGFAAFRMYKSVGFITPRNLHFESGDSTDTAVSAERRGMSAREAGWEAGSSSALDQPYAQPRSVVTGRHDAGSGANETADGLNELEESMRHAAEDTPSGRNERAEDIPVFDRGDLPPRI